MRGFREWYGSYRSFSFWFNGVCLLLLVVLGTSGIVLLLLSLRNRRSQYRLTWHVRLLCMWDAAALLFILGLASVPSLWNKSSEIYGPTSYFIRVFLPLSNMANLGSTWQVIAIAAERFLAVAYPLKFHTRSKTSLKVICSLIAIGAIITYGPIVFESTSSECFNPETKDLSAMLLKREFTKNPTYKWIVNRIPNFLLRSPTPFALLVFLTAETLRRRKVALDQHPGKRDRERGNNTPLILTILNIKFILLQSLPVAYDIMNIFKVLSRRQEFYMADISNLLLAIQSATNWLVFVQWNEQSSKGADGRKQSSMISFTENEIHSLRSMYQQNICNKMALITSDLCDAITRNNLKPSEELDLLSLSPDSLECIFRSITSDSWLDASDELRALGINMCRRRSSRIEAHNWTHAKNCIVSALMGARTCEGERAAANKFASFVIREIRHGMLCQRTELSASQSVSVL